MNVIKAMIASQIVMMKMTMMIIANAATEAAIERQVSIVPRGK